MIEIAVWCAGAIGLAILLGAGAEYWAGRRDRRRFPPPGRLISVAGETVHVIEKGKAGPPVIFLAGLGNSALAFSWIDEKVSSAARTYALDRPGLGWSARARASLTAEHSADVVAAALDELKIEEPVIVVAHSFGGVVSRVFASKYPGKVAGLVMIDSAHEEQLERFPFPVSIMARFMLFKNTLQKWRSYIGLMRLPGALHDQGHGLPERAQQAFYALLATPKHRRAAASEAKNWRASRKAAMAARDFGSKPLYVLTADQWPQVMLPTRLELQKEIAGWSRAGRQEVLAGSDHVSIAYSEHFGSIVADRVLEMIERRSQN